METTRAGVVKRGARPDRRRGFAGPWLLVGVLGFMSIPGVSVLVAQESRATFEHARELALSGQRDSAKAVARAILQESPDYVDVRVLLGRVHSWDDEFDEARRQLTLVLETRPDYTDARSALVDVELWSDNYPAALAEVDRGLTFDPGDAGLRVKKAEVLRSMGRYDEAETVVREVLEEFPDNSQALVVLDRIQSRPATNEMQIDYSFDRFSTFSDDWHEVSLSATKRGWAGSVTIRGNLASRFGRDGGQFEIDAYPSIVDGVYAYLNIGTSSTSFYPELRWGSELYVSLPWSLEASFGARELHFSSSDVLLYTGSLGMYQGNFWFSGRIFYKESTDSYSTLLNTRYYLGDRFNFIGLSYGFGSTPDVDDFSDVDRDLLDSRSYGFDMEVPVSEHFGITLNAGYKEEELTRDRVRYRGEFGAGLSVRF